MDNHATVIVLGSDATVPVYADLQAVSDAIAMMGSAQRDRMLVQASMNEEMSIIQMRCELEAAPYTALIARIGAGVKAYCEANRAEVLYDPKKKSRKLPAGEVKWRKGKDKVVVTGDEEALVDILKALELAYYTRVTYSLDKTKLLAEPSICVLVDGLSISEGEETFAIVPFATKLAEVVLSASVA